jgi:NAD(P)-dependent dehydrogenase (short-subunit alcohol dehydrogenase family)
MSPFGYRSTAREVAAGHALAGTRIIVTGAASGIGVETARALALAGAEVTIAARDQSAARKVADALDRPARSRRRGVDPRLRRQLVGAAAYPDQQRRGHGLAADAHGAGL